MAEDSARRRKREGPGRYALAVALALVGHLFFVTVLLFLSLIHLGEQPDKRKWHTPPRAVTLRPINSGQWAENRGDKRSNDSRLTMKEPDVPKRDEKKPEAIPK